MATIWSGLYVSFSKFFSFLSIFQVLQCVFLNLHVFKCFSPYSRTYIFRVSFSTLFSFLPTFQVIKCLCLIFQVFQFPRHNPGTTVKFFIFHVIHHFLPYSRSYCVCFSFSTIFIFLIILQVLQCAFLIFPVFECFSPI